MEIFYCTGCSQFIDADRITNVTPPPRFNAIDPPDEIGQCTCGRKFAPEEQEDYYKEGTDIIDLLNEHKISL